MRKVGTASPPEFSSILLAGMVEGVCFLFRPRRGRPMPRDGWMHHSQTMPKASVRRVPAKRAYRYAEILGCAVDGHETAKVVSIDP
jgi:hypothetical protein